MTQASETETQEEAAAEEDADFITVFYNATEGGTVSVASERVNPKLGQQQATGSTAQAKEGYRFLYWQTADQSAVMSFEPAYAPMIWGGETEDLYYKAVFEAEEDDQPFYAEGSAGYVSVKVSGRPGTFPKNTEMVVLPADEAQIKALANKASEDGVEVVDVVAVDITFWHEGIEVQPNYPVSVELHSERAVQGEAHSAIHVDGGNVQSIGGASEQDTIVAADSFSVYGIIGEEYGDDDIEQHKRVTYVFTLDGTLETEVGRQTVRDGDTLIGPATIVDTPNRTLKGWLLGTTALELPMEVTIPDDAEGKGEEIILTAEFDTYSNVTFLNEEDGAVLAVKHGKSGEVVDWSDIDVKVTANQVITGWKKQGTDTKLTEIKFGDEDYTLVPVIENVVGVTFNSNADGDPVTHIDAVYVKKGETVNEPTTKPNRTGYTFVGWYTEATGGTKVKFPLKVNEETTLYAHWTASKTVKYTVFVWKESIGTDGNPANAIYALDKTEVKQNGTAGADVAALADGLQSQYGSGSGYSYHSYARTDYSDAKLKGDGSTVINLYYNLKTIKFNFKVSGGGASLKAPDGKTYTNGQTYSFDAKLGQYIGDKWPLNITRNNYNFDGWGVYATKQIYVNTDLLDNMRDDTVTFTSTWNNGSILNKFHYHLELPDGSGYYDDPDYQQEFIDDSDYDPKGIDGYNYERSDNKWIYSGGKREYYEYNFYYKRWKQTLQFYNYNTFLKDREKTNIRWGASIDDANYSEPPVPSVLAGKGYVFGGWYTDKSCAEGTKFNHEGAVMPRLGDNAKFILYAKWTPVQHTVSFDLNGADGEIADQTVNHGSTATQPDDPQRENHRFAGWMNGDKAYNFSEPVTADITLTAKWLMQQAEYEIVYMYNGAAVLTSTQKYSDGSSVVAAGAPAGIEANKAFIGWSLDSTNVSSADAATVKPGALFTVSHANADDEGKIYLYAVTVPKYEQVQVTYQDPFDPNNVLTHPGKSVAVNGTYPLLSPDDFGWEHEGYVFLGWQTDQGLFPAGKDVAVNATGQNIAVAQWELQLTSYTVKYYKDSIADGNYLGEAAVDNQVIGTSITLDVGTTEGKLDYKKPAAGYKSGVQQGGALELAATGNVINVLYSIDDNQTYTVTYEAQEGGSVSPTSQSDHVLSNAAITGSTATADAGYKFVGWKKGDAEIGENEILSGDDAKSNLNGSNGVYEDTTYTAKFELLPQLYVWSGDTTAPYDGKYHYIEAPYATEADDAEGDKVEGVKILYYKYNNEDKKWEWVEKPSHLMVAGTKTVTIKATKDGYRDSEPKKYKITVTPRDIYIEVDDQSITYGETLPEFTCKVYMMENGVKTLQGYYLNGIDTNQHFNNLEVGLPEGTSTDAGVYEITALDADGKALVLGEDGLTKYLQIQRSSGVITTKGTKSFNIRVIPGTLTITPADGLEIKAQNGGGVCNDTKYTGTVTVNVTEGTTLECKHNFSGFDKLENATGTRTMDLATWKNTLSVRSGQPYALSANTCYVMVKAHNPNYKSTDWVKYQIDVTPREVYVTATAPEGTATTPEGVPFKIYGEQDPEFTFEAEQVNGDRGLLSKHRLSGVAVTRQKRKDGTYAENWLGSEGVGDYAIEVDLAGAMVNGYYNGDDNADLSKNYNLIPVNGTFKIEQAELRVNLAELSANYSDLVRTGTTLKYTLNPDEVTRFTQGFVGEFNGDGGPDHFETFVLGVELNEVGQLAVTEQHIEDVLVRRNPEVTHCYKIFLDGALRVIDDRPTPAPEPSTTPTDEPTDDPTDEPADEPATTPAQAEDPAVLGVTRAPEVIAEVTAFNADQDTAEVLGARRTTDAQQVLGARRGQTGDVDMSSNYMILCAALAGLMLILAGKRRNRG